MNIGCFKIKHRQLLITGVLIVVLILGYKNLLYCNPSYISEVQYGEDGNHIYYVQVYDFILDATLDVLFCETIQKKNDFKIYQGYPRNIKVAPSGNRILFKDHNQIVIMNTKPTYVIKRVATDAWDYGWHPEGNKIWYTKSDEGTYLFDIIIGKKQKLSGISEKGYRVLGWSNDGKYILCFKPFEFAMFDYLKGYITKTFKIRFQETIIKNAFIDRKNETIFYSYENQDGLVGIGRVNVLNGEIATIWSHQARLLTIDNLKFTKSEKGLIFCLTRNFSRDYRDERNVSELYYLRTSDGWVKMLMSLPSLYGRKLWDYSPKSNKIVWYDSNLKRVKEIELKW